MPISFARHQFPPAIIRHAVWLYVRFTLSYRDVEDLLAERGLDVSYETVRRWVLKFGPLFARELRRRRPRPTSQWHLDEMAVMIAGRQFWLWRAVDQEGEVLDLLVQRRRDKPAAMKLMRKLLKKQGFAPDVLVTDKLRSYGAAKAEIGLSTRHEQGVRKNNRPENSHQPTRRRERKMQRFISTVSGLLTRNWSRAAMTWPPFIADGHTWATACGAPISGLSTYERAQKPSLSSAECPEDALICMRRASVISEGRLILIRSRENRQQLGKR